MAVNPKLNQIIDCLYRVSAKAIIVHDKRLLLVKEPEGWFALPGGGIEHEQTIKQTIERELEEEISLPANSIAINLNLFTFSMAETVDGIPRMQLYYKVNILDASKVNNNELSFIWADLKQLKKLSLSKATASILDKLQKLL